MSHVVVLGGGICGLAAGMHPAENGHRVTVLEAQHFLGGRAPPLRGRSGAGFDFGPHAYHARNQRVLDMFKAIAHDGFPAQAKNVRIKFRGRYYKYPLEAMDLARSMDPLLALKAFVDYFGEVVRRKIRPRTLVSAEDWVTQAMGRTLYELFFGPYTQKVWGVPPSQLAASFAQHRIPHIALGKVVLTSLRTGRAKITGTEHRYAPLVVELYYPPRGAGLISQRMAERIRARGGEVRTGTLVTGTETRGGRGVRKPRALPAQAIYFQDKTFNRLSETRNYGGSDICGPDETVLLCDITCDVGDAIWTADPDELGRRCARELEAEGFLKTDEVVGGGG